jgi:hypothetical protein
VERCEYVHPEWGRCSQPWFIHSDVTHCIFHDQWRDRMQAGTHPDVTYHRKIVEGLLTPTLGVLTDPELRTLFGADEQRGDRGRRLDQWKLPP